MGGDDGHFDEGVAARYDVSVAERFEQAVVDPAVDFLAELAEGRPALELGIGTGRIALPLARRGVPVHGIDLSRAMVARLRRKPGAEQIGVSIGDFSTTTVQGEFALVYLVFDTLTNLTTQAAQVACFRNAAAHLAPGRLLRGRGPRPPAPAAAAGRDDPPVPGDRDAVGLRRVRRRRAGDDLAPLRDRGGPGGAPLDPVPVRVAGGAGPHGRARRDAAARAVGRVDPGPFTAASAQHVSVWQKPARREPG